MDIFHSLHHIYLQWKYYFLYKYQRQIDNLQKQHNVHNSYHTIHIYYNNSQKVIYHNLYHIFL